MERLEIIYQVMNKVKRRFGSPREAFNKLVTGQRTKIKFIVAMHWDLEISPYEAG
jgi:hypothetical protein